VPDQVAEKDEASLEQSEHEQVTIRVRGSDLRAQLAHPCLNRCLVVHHTLDCAPIEARIVTSFRRARAHTDTR